MSLFVSGYTKHGQLSFIFSCYFTFNTLYFVIALPIATHRRHYKLSVVKLPLNCISPYIYLFCCENNSIHVGLKANLIVQSWTMRHGYPRRPVSTLYSGHIRTAEQRTIIQQRCLVHWPLMGGLLHLVQRERAWADCGSTNFILSDVSLYCLCAVKG